MARDSSHAISVDTAAGQEIRGLKYFSALLLVGIAYFFSAKLGLSLAFVNASATAVWPPTAIAFAAALLLGYRLWPAIFWGAFFANLTTAGTILTSLGIATGNTLEALLGAYLVNRLAGGRGFFETSRNIAGFVILAGFVSTVVSATIGVSVLILGALAQRMDYLPVWLTWWWGDATGNLVFAPLLVLFGLGNFRFKWDVKRAVEAALLIAAALLVGFGVFSGLFFGRGEGLPLDFLMILVVVWSALRFGQRGAALATTTVAMIAIWGTLHGFGPFVRESPNASLLLLQVFMAFNSIAGIGLARISMDRDLAEEQLLGEKAQQEAVLASIGDGLVVTNREGEIIFVNPQAEEMLGWSAGEVIGRRAHHLVSVEDEGGNVVPVAERPMTIALETGRPVSTAGVRKYYYVRRDKSKFPVALTATPIIVNGAIVGAVDLIKDITLEDIVDRAKNEFISVAAHQLRTPLSSIKWLLELVLKGSIGSTEKKKVEEAYAANERLINIVRDLLNISRLEAGRVSALPEAVDGNEAVAAVIRLCEADLAQKKVRVQFEPAKTACVISTNSSLFSEALRNVLDNAITYAPPKSQIGVGVTCDARGLTVAIKNGGPAIDPSERENIFKKFYRGTEAPRLRPSGSGLGLYIAKLNVETLGGKIWFESPISEGKGTTFYIRLPIRQAKA